LLIVEVRISGGEEKWGQGSEGEKGKRKNYLARIEPCSVHDASKASLVAPRITSEARNDLRAKKGRGEKKLGKKKKMGSAA